MKNLLEDMTVWKNQPVLVMSEGVPIGRQFTFAEIRAQQMEARALEKAALESEGYGIMGVGDDIASASWKRGVPVKDNPLPVSPDAQNHMRTAVDKVKTNKGVTGAHNINEFDAALKSTGKDISNMYGPSNVKEVPGFPGLKEIEYKVPLQDGKTGYLDTYKAAEKPKTVYDPSVPGYSDAEMYRYGLEAMENGFREGRIVRGEASNGMKFLGYVKNGEITNFHPVASFD